MRGDVNFWELVMEVQKAQQKNYEAQKMEMVQSSRFTVKSSLSHQVLEGVK